MASPVTQTAPIAVPLCATLGTLTNLDILIIIPSKNLTHIQILDKFIVEIKSQTKNIKP
jgi:hypothetical protein